jgi:GTP-binding protein LepA
MTEQFLDSMDLERERGITIKQHSVRLEYKARNGQDYLLNLIDTPGHVDFAYEVSRSLAACQGALLVVDASQGVEAQTLANAHLAADAGLEIIPVLNKVDLPGAEPERAKEQIEQVIGIDASGAIPASAKMGIGIDEILEAIVARIPPPKGDPDGPFRGLVFDSWFDQYRGVVVLVHVVDGRLEPGMKVRLMATGGVIRGRAARRLHPKPCPVDALAAGEVGFVIAGIKRVRTSPSATRSPTSASPPRSPARVQGDQADGVRRAVPGGRRPVRRAARRAREAPPQRLVLLLRARDLGRARLRLPLRLPGPAAHGDRPGAARARVHPRAARDRRRPVRYRVLKTTAEISRSTRPRGLPDPGSIEAIEEPIITATILTGDEYVGAIIKLCQDKRGIQKGIHYITPTRVMIQYELPLAEILLDFYDKLKSVSKGYASLDYEFTGHWVSPLVKLDVLVNGDPVDALSLIVHRDTPTRAARRSSRRCAS